MILTVNSFMAYGATLTLSGAMDNLDCVVDAATMESESEDENCDDLAYDMVV